MKTADEEAKEQARAQLAYWQQQAAMTDEQILKVYCDEKRRFAIGQVNMIQKHMAEDAKVEEEIRLYGGRRYTSHSTLLDVGSPIEGES